MNSSQTFDLGIALSWHFDNEFVNIIESIARSKDLTTYVVHAGNVNDTVAALQQGRLTFRYLLDRASDENEAFLPLAELFKDTQHNGISQTRVINPYHLMARAADKATMHLELLAYGIRVPYTIILPPYLTHPHLKLSPDELTHLGSPFIIKPANTTGGGIGVVTDAKSPEDVLKTRQHHPTDKYLLQETIRPAYLSEDRGWFRVFYCFGTVIPCWWDDLTHVYEEVTDNQVTIFGLQPLRDIAATIAQICCLDFFSTEIVFTTTNTFIVVDYVNELCDMRLQSLHPDGVPDSVVQRIVETLLSVVAQNHSSLRPATVASDCFHS